MWRGSRLPARFDKSSIRLSSAARFIEKISRLFADFVKADIFLRKVFFFLLTKYMKSKKLLFVIALFLAISVNAFSQTRYETDFFAQIQWQIFGRFILYQSEIGLRKFKCRNTHGVSVFSRPYFVRASAFFANHFYLGICSVKWNGKSDSSRNFERYRNKFPSQFLINK